MYISKTEGFSNIICQSKTDRGMSRPGSKDRGKPPNQGMKCRVSACVVLQSLRSSQLTWGLSPLPKMK